MLDSLQSTPRGLPALLVTTVSYGWRLVGLEILAAALNRTALDRRLVHAYPGFTAETVVFVYREFGRLISGFTFFTFTSNTLIQRTSLKFDHLTSSELLPTKKMKFFSILLPVSLLQVASAHCEDDNLIRHVVRT